VLNVKDLNDAMDCLEKALEQYPGRTAVAQEQNAVSNLQ